MKIDKKANAKLIDLRDFVESQGGETKRKGEKLLALCPFHNDSKLGSFYVDKDYFKCFACGAHGDIITYVMDVQGISFLEALDFLAKEDSRLNLGKIKKSLKKEKISLDYELVNEVYSKIIEESTLNSEDFEHLTKNRFFKKEDIETHNLFSFSGSKALEIATKYFSKEELLGVPGFYLYNGALEVVRITGIGIPIKFIDGKIRGIQVRKMEKFASPRYVFFSTNKGLSVSSPSGFLDGKNKEKIIITEGFFKGERLNKYFDHPTFFLQGVNSYNMDYKKIVDYANENNIDTIVIAFDSDFVYKPILFKGKTHGVYKAMVDLSNLFIKDFFYLEYLMWKGKEKGFDDYYNKSEKIEPIFVNKALFDAHYESFDKSYSGAGYERKKYFDNNFNFKRVLA